MWVLIVEDEKRMAELLRQGLEEEGHSVTLAFDGGTGLAAALGFSFDVIVLDVMLPRLDGLTVARRLRDQRVATPILLLTARDTVSDIVSGLDSGADDYLTKPFSFQELLARLRALARRAPSPPAVRLQVADLVLDPATHEVSRGEEKIALTPTEYRLLEFLMRRAGRVAPRDAILSAVWGVAPEVESNTLDAFIKSLRSKIDAGRAPRLIQTVRGVGYSLRSES